MSTLYIRHYARASMENATTGLVPACPFALVSNAGTIEREGVALLTSLSGVMRAAGRIVLLLAANDVTLLQVKVPPLSAAKLKAAWPNLVEEQLMCDPAECVIVPLEPHASDGLRSVAVVQRAWLMSLLQNVSALGARNVVAVPAQLCMPIQKEGVFAALLEQGGALDLILRWSDETGMGLSIFPEHGTEAKEAVQALRAIVPALPISLIVPQAQVLAYQKIVDEHVTVIADNWPCWIAGAKAISLNLMAGLRGGSRFDRRRWRWPGILMTMVVMINIAGLHSDWWRMRHEAALLRSAMFQTYQSSYPGDTVIVDPLAQMQQKIVAAKHAAGQLDADDFILLTARFGEAWRSVTQNRAGSPDIAGLEYRERSLMIKFKTNGELPMAAMQSALALRHLLLTQPEVGVWQVRSDHE